MDICFLRISSDAIFERQYLKQFKALGFQTPGDEVFAPQNLPKTSQNTVHLRRYDWKTREEDEKVSAILCQPYHVDRQLDQPKRNSRGKNISHQTGLLTELGTTNPSTQNIGEGRPVSRETPMLMPAAYALKMLENRRRFAGRDGSNRMTEGAKRVIDLIGCPAGFVIDSRSVRKLAYFTY